MKTSKKWRKPLFRQPKPQGGQRPPWGFVRAARARRPPSGARARAAERAA